MAGVCQYSVEVKSRFSLFWDDSLNNEDPELLLMKLQSERNVRSKKEKNSAHQERSIESQPEEVTSVKEVVKEKTNKADLAEKPADHGAPSSEVEQRRSQPPFRGRGGPRGFVRSFRGGRGFGPRATPADTQADSNAEAEPKKDFQGEFRGRGRGRPRGNRGRGMPYTDYRQHDNRRQTGNQQPVPETVSSVETAESAVVTPDGDAAQQEEPSKNENTDNAAKAEVEEVEEAKCLTLEEYKAMRKGIKPVVNIATKDTRKANDGKDVFANMVPHRKISDESDEEIVEVEKVIEEDRTIDIDVTYKDRLPTQAHVGAFPRGRGGRGRTDRGGRWRGNFRGRGFGGGASNDSHTAAPPVIYNDQEFPSLK